MTWLLYDGTFAGLLSSVFAVYERKLSIVRICTYSSFQPDAFATTISIDSDTTKAARVWKGLQKKLSSKGLKWIYYTYLSQLPDMENAMMSFIRLVFAAGGNVENDYGNPVVLSLSDITRKVGREKHRMEAFVRFRQTKENLYYAAVEPDFNVLPIITPHFKNRYADQHWLIYDVKRRYGIQHNCNDHKVNEVTISWNEGVKPGNESSEVFTPEEGWYQKLWQDYFKSTGIPHRKNMRLHVQHVPRRYWKYFTEKHLQ